MVAVSSTRNLNENAQGMSKDKGTTIAKNTNVQENACKYIKLVCLIICLLCFFANSYAIFKDFASGRTIISTTVLPSPDGLMESPYILICNSSAYKEPVLYMDSDSFRNNTMGVNEVLIDVILAKRANEGTLNIETISIKEKVKIIATMFQGTCLIIDEKLKVN